MKEIKYILPLPATLLVGLIFLFIPALSDTLMSYRYGLEIYFYSFLVLSMTLQIIYTNKLSKKNKTKSST